MTCTPLPSSVGRVRTAVKRGRPFRGSFRGDLRSRGRRRAQGRLVPDAGQRERNVPGGRHQKHLVPDVGQRGMSRPGRQTRGHQAKGTPRPRRRPRGGGLSRAAHNGGNLGLDGGRRTADGGETSNIYITYLNKRIFTKTCVRICLYIYVTHAHTQYIYIAGDSSAWVVV